MSGPQRYGLVGLAAVIAVGGFALARPGDDEADEPASRPAAQTASAPDPEPEVHRLRVRGGEPVGGVTEIGAEKGDTVSLSVSTDAPAHVHVHGYDIVRDAAPDAPARFRFEADVEGIFEIELEDTHTQIAELRVEP